MIKSITEEREKSKPRWEEALHFHLFVDTSITITVYLDKLDGVCINDCWWPMFTPAKRMERRGNGICKQNKLLLWGAEAKGLESYTALKSWHFSRCAFNDSSTFQHTHTHKHTATIQPHIHRYTHTQSCVPALTLRTTITVFIWSRVCFLSRFAVPVGAFSRHDPNWHKRSQKTPSERGCA